MIESYYIKQGGDMVLNAKLRMPEASQPDSENMYTETKGHIQNGKLTFTIMIEEWGNYLYGNLSRSSMEMLNIQLTELLKQYPEEEQK
ncbi:hypothetical protein BI001_gp213 [Bacillus phage Zuko]|uniref:hypothetical protein n=1 Tax=Bacillus phage Zuko TaxID=1805956 RepID=UPI0007A772E0|nr:hypothetical protein BI001_gp213 [Bacillus phage Zuko]AMW62574.1 hypothetical protein ZUKO_165 [Bacillus phage Zuko]AXF42012.1 hypothetical protein [Bacillus phage Saddex]